MEKKNGNPAETTQCNEPLSDKTTTQDTSPNNPSTDSVANKEEKKDNPEVQAETPSEEQPPASTKSEDKDMPAQQQASEGQSTEVQNKQHDLQFAWTFWYVYTLSHREKKKQKRVRHYEYVLHEVFTFNTLEDFWKMQNNVYTTSEVISNTDYLMFKKHIKPEWEDPANKSGGKWVITLPIEEDFEEECDEAWTNLLLHIVGGIFSYEQMELINGVIYSIRDKHQRMSIWCNVGPTEQHKKTLLQIGKLFKKLVQLPAKYKFLYQLHEKALQHDLDNEATLQV